MNTLYLSLVASLLSTSLFAIENGQERSYRQMVSVSAASVSKTSCGAAWIGPRVLLTSAQCGDQGDFMQIQDHDRVIYGRLHVHPAFDKKSNRNDVALIVSDVPARGFAPWSVAKSPRVSETFYGMGLGCGGLSTIGTFYYSKKVDQVAESNAFEQNGFLGLGKVIQSSQVCSGDKGGPALVKDSADSQVFGVISQVQGEKKKTKSKFVLLDDPSIDTFLRDSSRELRISINGINDNEFEVNVAVLPKVKASPKVCLPDNSLCVGDFTYGFRKGAPLLHGQITELTGKSAFIESTEITLNDVARPKLEAIKKNGQTGVLLGLFPSGYAVAAFGKSPISERKTNFEIFQPTCTDLKDLGKALSEVADSETLAFNSLKACPAVEIDNCNESYKPQTATNSPMRAHFSKLLRAGKNAPLSAFLQLWHPNRKLKLESNEDSYILKCQSAPWMQFRGNIGEYFPKSCTADTLYSWGPAKKITSMKQQMKDGAAWNGSPNPGGPGLLWTTASASATYPFGFIGARIKIKSGVRTLVTEWKGKEPGVVNYGVGWAQDYTISDASVIDSWSYGTPEHYDEIVRDVLRFSSGRPGMHWSAKHAPQGHGVNRLFSYWVDNYPNNEEALKTVLLEMVRMILHGEGRVQYADGVCRNRGKHFETGVPSYMNP